MLLSFGMLEGDLLPLIWPSLAVSPYFQFYTKQGSQIDITSFNDCTDMILYEIKHVISWALEMPEGGFNRQIQVCCFLCFQIFNAKLSKLDDSIGFYWLLYKDKCYLSSQIL